MNQLAPIPSSLPVLSTNAKKSAFQYIGPLNLFKINYIESFIFKQIFSKDKAILFLNKTLRYRKEICVSESI